MSPVRLTSLLSSTETFPSSSRPLCYGSLSNAPKSSSCRKSLSQRLLIGPLVILRLSRKLHSGENSPGLYGTERASLHSRTCASSTSKVSSQHDQTPKFLHDLSPVHGPKPLIRRERRRRFIRRQLPIDPPPDLHGQLFRTRYVSDTLPRRPRKP